MKNPVDGLHERCPVSTQEVFWKLSPKNHQDEDIFNEYIKRHGWKPDIHIYLKVPATTCLKNIRKRSQVGDEHITLEYLKQIEECYENIRFDYIVDGTSDPKSVANIIKQLIV